MLAFHRAGRRSVNRQACRRAAARAPRIPRQQFNEFELACGLLLAAFLVACFAYLAVRAW